MKILGHELHNIYTEPNIQDLQSRFTQRRRKPYQARVALRDASWRSITYNLQLSYNLSYNLVRPLPRVLEVALGCVPLAPNGSVLVRPTLLPWL